MGLYEIMTPEEIMYTSYSGNDLNCIERYIYSDDSEIGRAETEDNDDSKFVLLTYICTQKKRGFWVGTPKSQEIPTQTRPKSPKPNPKIPKF
jgi:hypothetical protein